MSTFSSEATRGTRDSVTRPLSKMVHHIKSYLHHKPCEQGSPHVPGSCQKTVALGELVPNQDNDSTTILGTSVGSYVSELRDRNGDAGEGYGPCW